MAPNTPDTVGDAQKQARRSAPRIVPAIPHRFSRPQRSARPITPEESTKTPVTQPEPEPQAAAEKEKEPDEQAAASVQTPLTPDSKASTPYTAKVEEPALASSPADTADDHVEVSLDTRVSEASVQQSPPPDTPSVPYSEPPTASVNGDVPAPATPAELPPEFHPAEKPMIPTPTVGGAEEPFHEPSATFPVHRSQPSVEGLVFGGAVQESPAMPSTPQDMEPDMRAAHPALTRPPPGFAPPQFAQQFYPGHSHHPSDPVAPWIYPAYPAAAPADGVYPNGQSFESPSFPVGQMAHQAPYHGQTSPRMAPVTQNGSVRSPSQSPSKSHFGETKTSSNADEGLHTALYQNGGLPHHAEGPGEEPFKLAAYLFHQFGNPEFADFLLQIRSGDAVFLAMSVHGIIVARSPVIAEAIRRTVPPAFRSKDQRRLVDILITDKFISPESLNEAVKILYGAPLLSVQPFLYGLARYDRDGGQSPTYNEARKRMEHAMSYAAAGRALKISSMQLRGLELVKALLRWDTIEPALHCGLEAGRSAIPSEAGVVDTYATSLVDDALDFIAYNFPVDFSLYTLAPELRYDPRLPSVIEFRQPTHNPRLSKIRFGDAPPENELMPSYVTQTLSSVLLSLPLPLLDRLFSHPAAANQLGWTGLVKIMRDVIDEREKRREKALKSKIRPLPDGTVPRPLLENLYQAERVEPSAERPSGHRLTASRLAGHA